MAGYQFCGVGHRIGSTSDRPVSASKIDLESSQTFSAKRRSVAVQHCAFWGVLGGIWLGGKFSHAKTSIEHKRRYAHRFSERFSKDSTVVG